MTQEITDWLINELEAETDENVLKVFGGTKPDPIEFFIQPDSLRLRAKGYQILRYYFDHEEFLHNRDFLTGEILTLSRHMNAPFYINKNKLVLFSQENIVMCKLAGDVASWLKNFP